MENTIPAQEIKRRGISVVDEALKHGPVHVIQRNRPRYVILSEEAFQRLAGGALARQQLWTRLLDNDLPAAEAQTRAALDAQLRAERGDWRD